MGMPRALRLRVVGSMAIREWSSSWRAVVLIARVALEPSNLVVMMSISSGTADRYQYTSQTRPCARGRSPTRDLFVSSSLPSACQILDALHNHPVPQAVMAAAGQQSVGPFPSRCHLRTRTVADARWVAWLRSVEPCTSGAADGEQTHHASAGLCGLSPFYSEA
jgi:hypothetical protein